MQSETLIAEPTESTAITLEAEATEETAPRTKLIWEGRWNHETNRAEWSQIEVPDESEVKPKLKETPKYSRAARRMLRATIRRQIHKATTQRLHAMPKQCQECGAPFQAVHIPIYETTPEGEATDKVIRTVLWRCQCKAACKAKVYTEVYTGDEAEAEQA